MTTRADLWEEVVLGAYMQWSETYYAAQFIEPSPGRVRSFLSWVFEERTLDDAGHQFGVRADYELEMLNVLEAALKVHFGLHPVEAEKEGLSR